MAGESKAQDVIITDCVVDDGEGLAFHRHGKRLVPANVTNVVDEAQVLEFPGYSVYRAARMH